MSGVKVTYYYADWCGYCKMFRGEWEKFKSMAGGYDIEYDEMEDAQINALNGPVIVGGKKLRGYPSIKVECEEKGKGVRNLEYRGERTANALLAFAKRQSME